MSHHAVSTFKCLFRHMVLDEQTLHCKIYSHCEPLRMSTVETNDGVILFLTEFNQNRLETDGTNAESA